MSELHTFKFIAKSPHSRSSA